MQIVQTGGKPRAYKVHAVAVYDSETGRVLHIHHAVAFAGRKAPAATELAKAALEHATKAGHTVKTMAALALKEAPAPGAYRVDLKRKSLVLVAAPERRRPVPR